MSQQPTDITDEERTVFRDAVQGTTPMPPMAHVSHARAKIKARVRQQVVRDTPSIRFVQSEYSTEEQAESETIISFFRPHLHRNQIRQLKRGPFPFQAQIDLHFLTCEEAETEIEKYFEICERQSIVHVCIIHGKGTLTQGQKPILKNFLRQWLRTHPKVLGYHSARPQDGGAGALYVLLKRRSMPK